MNLKSKKKVAVFLVVAMLFTLFPMSAFAYDDGMATHSHDGVTFSNLFAPDVVTTSVFDYESGSTTEKAIRLVTTGNYYLGSDYSDDLNLNVEGEVHLCLNGYELHADHINVLENAELYIYDCGTAEHKFRVDNNGLWVKDSGGTKTISGGIITCMVMVHGAVDSADSAGEFYLHNGTIVGADGPTLYNLGKIYIGTDGAIVGNTSDDYWKCVIFNSGECFENSGTIAENTSTETIVYNDSLSQFVNSGTITDNTSNATIYNLGRFINYGKVYNNNGGGIASFGSLIVGGNSNVTNNTKGNIYLDRDVVIEFDENIPLDSDASMGVRSVVTAPVVITSGCSSTAAAYFFADKETQELLYKNNVLMLCDKVYPSYSGDISDAKTDISSTKKDIVSTYPDIDVEAWYYEAVAFCIEHGILIGFPDGTFQPNTATSRAMLAAVLWRLEGSPTVNYAMDYSDVKADDWYAEAVRWVSSEQLARGYGNKVFGPNDVITREQQVAMLHNYAIYKGYDVSVGENTNILSYDDAFDISSWAYPAMQWACGSGLLNSETNGLIGPANTLTRAQTAVMMKQYIEQNGITLP